MVKVSTQTTAARLPRAGGEAHPFARTVLDGLGDLPLESVRRMCSAVVEQPQRSAPASTGATTAWTRVCSATAPNRIAAFPGRDAGSGASDLAVSRRASES